MKPRYLSLVALGFGSLALAADWPQYRGPTRDNKIADFAPPASWPKELKQKWKVPVGDGVSSPALVGDKLYVFVREGDNEVVRCVDAATGKEVWKDAYPAQKVKGAAAGFKGREPFTGPRSSPAVVDGKVCTLGVAGVVSCLDAATGKVLWRKDTDSWPIFYTSTSPVVLDGLCIVHVGGMVRKDGEGKGRPGQGPPGKGEAGKGGPPGKGGGGKGGGGFPPGKGELVAFDLNTGEPKWKWPGDGPSYGSPVVATLGGVKQVVTLTDQNLIGVGAADGKLLWRIPLTGPKYSTGTPVVDGQRVICIGSAFDIVKEGDTFAAKRVWRDQTPHNYNTPVLKDGLLYGLDPNTNFYCQDAKTGKVVWTDETCRGECGAVLDAGPVLMALTSDTQLVVFKPSKTGYEEVAKYKVADLPTWAYPIVDGKRVFVKDRDSLALWTIE